MFQIALSRDGRAEDKKILIFKTDFLIRQKHLPLVPFLSTKDSEPAPIKIPKLKINFTTEIVGLTATEPADSPKIVT
jgi:hypothetical protein